MNIRSLVLRNFEGLLTIDIGMDTSIVQAGEDTSDHLCM